MTGPPGDLRYFAFWPESIFPVPDASATVITTLTLSCKPAEKSETVNSKTKSSAGASITGAVNVLQSFNSC
jgi:hypothetical protein